MSSWAKCKSLEAKSHCLEGCSHLFGNVPTRHSYVGACSRGCYEPRASNFGRIRHARCVQFQVPKDFSKNDSHNHMCCEHQHIQSLQHWLYPSALFGSICIVVSGTSDFGSFQHMVLAAAEACPILWLLGRVQSPKFIMVLQYYQNKKVDFMVGSWASLLPSMKLQPTMLPKSLSGILPPRLKSRNSARILIEKMETHTDLQYVSYVLWNVNCTESSRNLPLAPNSHEWQWYHQRLRMETTFN